MNYDEATPRGGLMSLRQLEVFRAIMLGGSISEAARLLFVAQPSVSRVLAVTENRLGFALFERVRGRLFPTPEAKRIFDEVEQAYAGVQRVDDLIRALSEGRSGELNVVCSPSLGVHLVPRALARFNRAYPDLPVRFEPLTHNNLVPRVLLGNNFLGVSMFEVSHPNLHAETLAQARLVCASPHGMIERPGAVRLSDLRGLPWIDYPPDTPLGRIVGSVFTHEPRPRPHFMVRSAISACSLVQQGVGVALIDPFCIDATLGERIDIHPLQPARPFTVQAVYAHHEPLSHAARTFLDTLAQVLRESP